MIQLPKQFAPMAAKQAAAQQANTPMKSAKAEPLFGVRSKFDFITPSYERSGNAMSSEATRELDANYSGEAKVRVITNRQEFDRISNLISPNTDEYVEINFKKQAAVLVSQTSTGGSPSLTRKEINYDPATKQMRMYLETPDMSGMMTISVMGNAYYLAVVDKDKVAKPPIVSIESAPIRFA